MIETERLLLPCPFPMCGSKHTHVTEVFVSGKGGQFAGTCDACQSTGPCRASKAEAATAWNTRPLSPPDDAGMVERVAQSLSGGYWHSLNATGQEVYRHKARAAIKAMREG